ncbi:hypothetical protein I4U23_029093 [Adineta vaga]|nr:hypothetical protein I4U23_029093 [Adineta vaga]
MSNHDSSIERNPKRSRRRSSTPPSHSRSRLSSQRSRSRSSRRSKLSPLSSTSTRQQTEDGKRLGPKPNSILGVFGLSSRTTEKDLKDLFQRFGRLKDVQLIVDKKTSISRGFAFVYFETVNDATNAIESMRYVEIDGRNVRIEYSITQTAHKPTPGVYMGDRIPRPSNRSRTIYHRIYEDRKRKHYRSRSRSRSPRRIRMKFEFK